MPNKKTKKTCPKGHTFLKTLDCPTCPTCEAARAPATGFLSELYAPARRGLEQNRITSLATLAKYTEKEILDLHGLGPTAMPTLKRALQDAGMTFKFNAFRGVAKNRK